jgi:hypothetical protein
VKTLAIAFAASLLISWPQQGTRHSNTATSAPSLMPTKGLIDKGTYKNPSIGLEFTPAENLKLLEPEMKGTPGTTPLLITVQAASDRGLISGIFSAPSITIFYADALAFYPEEQRNVPRYLKKIIRTNEADGWQHVHGMTSGQMTDISFSRLDFAKGDVHEAVLVAVHDGYAFVFIFAGSDIGVANKLIAATQVKFTP